MPAKSGATRRVKQREKEAAKSTLHKRKKVDEIRVDARLEATGEATKPADKPAHPRPVKRDRSTVCQKCERALPTNHFFVLKHKTASSPAVKDTVCRACRAVEEADDLRAQNIERAAMRKEKEITRQMISNRAKTRAKKNRQSRVQATKKKQATNDEKTVAEHAQRELARRELARRRLLYFTRRFEGQKVDEKTGELVEVERAKGKGYVADWVHKDVCARLERFLAAVRAGKQPRLMLFMPPRHGKSTLASRMFPAWSMGQDPTLEIIAASYGSSLPEQFSRNVRGILRDPEYKAIFPSTLLDPERENIQGWATTAGGLYIPVGVGSGITGKGADLLIIDDPFKGAEDAESPNAREKVLDWYFSEAFTRLSPNAGVLVILTRWHDADLAGALLSSQAEQEKESFEIMSSELEEIEEAHLSEGDERNARALAAEEHKERLKDVERWEVISYAAIAEHDEYRLPDGRIVDSGVGRSGATLLRRKGEALHPSRYPLERLRKIRKNFYARGRQRFWHALYQQKPVPDEGIHFSRDMIKIVPPVPTVSRVNWLKLTAWDLAAGQKTQHDYTVGAHGLMDYEGTIHVMEIVRGRFEGAYGVACQVLDEYERNRSDMIGVEKGPLELFLMPSVDKELDARNKKRAYRERLTPSFATGPMALAPIQDPVLRAQPLQSVMQQGKLVFSRDLLWMEDTIAELIRFPGGVHDDIVTALSWLVRLALKFSAPRRPTVGQRRKSWKDKLSQYASGRGLGHMAA